MIRFRLCTFGRNTTEVILSGSQCIYAAISRITDSVNIDHLVKEFSARFLLCKVTVFAFLINIMVMNFKTIQKSCYFSNFYPLVLVFRICLNQLSWWLLKWWFPNFISASRFISAFYCDEEFSPYLFASVQTHEFLLYHEWDWKSFLYVRAFLYPLLKIVFICLSPSFFIGFLSFPLQFLRVLYS